MRERERDRDDEGGGGYACAHSADREAKSCLGKESVWIDVVK